MALFWKRKDTNEEFVTAKPGELFVRQEPGSPAPLPTETSPPVEPKPTTPLTEQGPHGDVTAEDAQSGTGLFGRMKTALSTRIQQTRQEIVGQIRAAMKAAGKVDENLIERIEEILIKADVGAETTMKIVDEMKEFEARGASTDELLDSFKQQLHKIVGHGERTLMRLGHKPYILLVIGVNGVGKTTTIGKMAAEFRAAGLKVMIVAGDTFRAAAVEQLEIWAKRTNSEFVSKGMGADPAGVAYDALTKADAEQFDVVLIDTAGRLHTKANLMEELKKIVRVIDRLLPGAPHETLLVLDATTGQNAISQAKVFTETINVTGIVMTKLDGTAKGGVLIGVRNLFDVPVLKIGVGEGVEDLRDFNPGEFVEALFAE
ncbi:MAG: signal recognition particle-docking protein FtsY [Candidatus Sumerlaeaceae bacterium]